MLPSLDSYQSITDQLYEKSLHTKLGDTIVSGALLQTWAF